MLFCSQEVSDQEFLQAKKHHEVNELNKVIEKSNPSLSPLKLPGYVSNNMKTYYLTLKRKQITDAFDQNICKKMKNAYEAPELSKLIADSDCVKCETFIYSIKESLKNCTSYNEKIRLLSIIPKDYSKESLVKLLPEVTLYMLTKARSIEIYSQPDTYAAHPATMKMTRL